MKKIILFLLCTFLSESTTYSMSGNFGYGHGRVFDPVLWFFGQLRPFTPERFERESLGNYPYVREITLTLNLNSTSVVNLIRILSSGTIFERFWLSLKLRAIPENVTTLILTSNWRASIVYPGFMRLVLAYFPRLRHLRIDHTRITVGATDLIALANSPFAKEIESLTLEADDDEENIAVLGISTTVECLCKFLSLKKLTISNFESATITNEFFDKLAQSSIAPQLEALILEGNYLTAESLHVKNFNQFINLKKLDIEAAELLNPQLLERDPDDAARIHRALLESNLCTSLESLEGMPADVLENLQNQCGVKLV